MKDYKMKLNYWRNSYTKTRNSYNNYIEITLYKCRNSYRKGMCYKKKNSESLKFFKCESIKKF